jgi:hypothetical protein
MTTIPNSAKVLIGVVVVASVLALALGLRENPQQLQGFTFPLLLAAAIIASRFKVKLPGLSSTMSGNLPVILLAVLQLNLLPACVIAAAAGLAQCYGTGSRRPKAVQVVFSTSVLVNSAALAYGILHAGVRQGAGTMMLWLMASAGVYFLANTAPVAGIVALTESKRAFQLWRQAFLWSFPNYVIGAGLSGIAASLTSVLVWKVLVTLLMVLYGVHRSYQMYVASSQAVSPRAMAAGTGH